MPVEDPDLSGVVWEEGSREASPYPDYMKKSKVKINPMQLYQQINFSESLSNPYLWTLKAKELLYAANKLKPVVNLKWNKIKIKDNKIVNRTRTPYIQGIYFMLIAYALENLCKAVILQRKKEALKNCLLKRVPSEIKSHDLLKLFKNIGLKTNITTEELLARLSRNAIWAARYPVPVESNKLTTHEKVSSCKQVFAAFFTAEDMNRIDSLINHFKVLIKKELDINI